MHRNITCEQIKGLFRYDEETGELCWRIRTGPQCKMGVPAGCVHPNGYRRICVNRKIYLAHRLIWLYHYGYLPENGVDHIDRNRVNNRIENLREVSQTCNIRNSCGLKNNTSGVKGVYFEKRKNKWRAHICVNYKRVRSRCFEKFEDAVIARYEKEKALNWNFCDSASTAFQYLKKNGLLPI